MIGRLRHFRKDTRGAGAVEFALVSPALILLIVGIAQLGILFIANAGLRNAVAEGARFATIYPRPTDDAIVQRITDRRFGLVPANVITPTIVHGTSDGAPYADITMSYDVELDFIFFSAGTIRLSETRRAFQQPATN